jgi:arylsulfatase A-like enzyme
MLSVEPPHLPDTAPEAYENRWRDRDITLPPNFAPRDEEHRQQLLTHRRLYYAMIENLDDNVGRMQRFLETQGLADDTIVVFLSDHGEMGGSHGLRQKSLPYEESAGVPLIIADPSRPELHGTTRDEVLCTEDMLPTLLGLMGTRAGRALPGLDASPLARDADATLDREGVLLEFISELRANYGATLHESVWRAFRTRDHLYAVRGDLHGATPWLLYDLHEDPYELNNLVEQRDHRDTAARLHRQLCDALLHYRDDFPIQPAFDHPGQHLYA